MSDHKKIAQAYNRLVEAEEQLDILEKMRIMANSDLDPITIRVFKDYWPETRGFMMGIIQREIEEAKREVSLLTGTEV